MTVANVLSYSVSVVASRRLGPAEFGVFAAMLSLVIVGVVVSLGLQTVVTRALAGQDRPDLGALAGTALAASLATGAVVAVAAWPIGAFLHLATPAPVLWTAATLVPLTWAGFVQGAAQGRERFGVLGVVVVAVSTGKVLGGLAGLAISRSATVTMALTAAGTLIGTALATAAARALLTRPRSRHWAVVDLAKAAHALFALFVLSNMDLLLARHYLPAVSAGLYGAGALVAKVAFWLPQFVSVVALPRLVDPKRHAGALRASVLLLVAIGATVTIAVATLGSVVVKIIGGVAYTDVAPYAWRFTALGSCMVLAQLLLYARLARHDHRAPAVVWSAVAVQVAVVAAVAHGSVVAIVDTTLAVVLVLVVVGLLAERSPRQRPAQTAPA
jgi:O-antigen/teichoic acid export membrane protein